ncbi:MAG: transglycosylase SLT domain-containing protein [Gammaproteobacteria bacterium]
MRSWIAACLLLGSLSGTSAIAAPGDEAVRQAQQAFVARKSAELARVVQSVPADHVLAPQVEFWQLLLALPAASDDRIAAFLAAHPGSWMAERLRAEWLKELGRRELWPAYRAEFARLRRPDVAHQCYARRAEWAAGDRSQLREAIALWFTGRDRPAACTPLFVHLRGEGLLQPEDVWRRYRLALEAGNPGVAKAVAAWLPEALRPANSQLDQAVRDPARWLADARFDSRGNREIGLYAINQIAKRDTARATAALQAREVQLTVPEQQLAWGLVATWAARRHEAVAPALFARAGAVVLSDAQREWWARSALRAGDWVAVRRAVDSMGEARTQPVWRYWHARALKAAGLTVPANQVFAALSREHHYYGQLAQEELGPLLQAPAINIKAGGADIDAVARHPGIARAVALYELGLRSEATQEWNWSIQEFSDAQLLAAAEVARRLGWFDRAIHTAERTRDLHDFELRFVAPYRELAQQAAREQQIDEAWVFGLMRQESRFVNVARSNVGASGLMQIMPDTARWIARRLGISRFHPREMQDPATNIRFGTYYLRHVLDSLDGSPVLATAAYNAGPGRAQRWRASQPMEGAVYVESIPFTETRDYVKKVLSNAMYYAQRFNQPSVLLKDRLGSIPPRRGAAPPAGETEPAGNDDPAG